MSEFKAAEPAAFKPATGASGAAARGTRRLPTGIYGITAQKFSRGRTNLQVVQEMIKGGVNVIQYREKHGQKSLREMYAECRRIRAMTRDYGVLFLVNDYIEIARLVDADGVHVGQDDLPLPEVRRLVGDKMIGLSTHSPAQAAEALQLGADYIGVGPIYRTRTKTDVCDPVGLDYLEYAAAHARLPFVAIGGIKEHNIAEIKARGARTICLVTDIVDADNIREKVQRLRALIGD